MHRDHKKSETLAEEKSRMVAKWDYYKKPNGEIDCLFYGPRLLSLYGLQAAFVLSYMRRVHKCCLLPIDG